MVNLQFQEFPQRNARSNQVVEPVGPLGAIRAKTRGVELSRINVQGDNRARCPPWMSYYLLISKEFRVAEVAGRQTLLNDGNVARTGPGRSLSGRIERRRWAINQNRASHPSEFRTGDVTFGIGPCEHPKREARESADRDTLAKESGAVEKSSAM